MDPKVLKLLGAYAAAVVALTLISAFGHLSAGALGFLMVAGAGVAAAALFQHHRTPLWERGGGWVYAGAIAAAFVVGPGAAWASRLEWVSDPRSLFSGTLGPEEPPPRPAAPEPRGLAPSLAVAPPAQAEPAAPVPEAQKKDPCASLEDTVLDRSEPTVKHRVSLCYERKAVSELNPSWCKEAGGLKAECVSMVTKAIEHRARQQDTPTSIPPRMRKQATRPGD